MVIANIRRLACLAALAALSTPISADIGCAQALIEGARLLAGAGDGLMPWRGRPEPLKRGLIARVPPLGFVEKDFQENFQETIG